MRLTETDIIACAMARLYRPAVAMALAMASFAAAHGAEPSAAPLSADTAAVASVDDAVSTDVVAPVARKGIVSRVIDYFADANKPKKHKKFDFNFIGGPHYSSETKFGLGVVAAGVYGIDTLRPEQPSSDVSLYGDITTTGFYMLGIRGNHIARHDRLRVIYDTKFSSQPTKMWGIGHAACDNDDNESKFKCHKVRVRGAALFKVAPGLFVGPMGRFDYISVDHIERPDLLPPGSPMSVSNNRFGLDLVYDSRDNLTAPHSGYYAGVSYYSRYLCIPVNDYHFDTVDLNLRGYHRLWKGAVLAYEYAMQLNWGEVPWLMMATIGGSDSMRGYYEGRYRDRNKMDTQVELRQHVYRRSGIVVWAGAGMIFDRFSRIRAGNILPDCGIGYRWEFKKNVNVRLDLGLGKGGQTGFVFNINEAF